MCFFLFIIQNTSFPTSRISDASKYFLSVAWNKLLLFPVLSSWAVDLVKKLEVWQLELKVVPVKTNVWVLNCYNCCISEHTHLLLVLKRTVSVRQFFWVPKAYFIGWEIVPKEYNTMYLFCSPEFGWKLWKIIFDLLEVYKCFWCLNSKDQVAYK